MRINSIYATYQGEANIGGIGHPVIFVRTQGCHIRCYKKTLGTLCDTTEALELGKGGKEIPIVDIVKEVERLSNIYGGIKLICLSGGDPLKQSEGELRYLFSVLDSKGYEVSVETSGTLSIMPYIDFTNVHWVLDYKTKSAGIKLKFLSEELGLLKPTDYIKFVLYDEADYNEFFAVVEAIFNLSKAKVVVGCYWGGKLKNEKLVELLMQDKLLGRVAINFQVHKMATLVDNTAFETFQELSIPKLL